jgi:transcriptional regulator with XRE-family HTH domain
MIPAALKAWREARGWTQDQMAEALSADPEQPKVTRVTIGRWERGESTPPPYLSLALERLAQKRRRPRPHEHPRR